MEKYLESRMSALEKAREAKNALERELLKRTLENLQLRAQLRASERKRIELQRQTDLKKGDDLAQRLLVAVSGITEATVRDALRVVHPDRFVRISDEGRRQFANRLAALVNELKR